MTGDIVDAAQVNTTAGKTPVKNFLEGAGLLQDTVGGVETIISGDWAGGLADLAAGSLDIKALREDPLTTVLAMGFGWLIKYVGPLKDLLDALTGNQNSLDLTARTWERISAQVQSTAEDLAESLNANCAGWTGAGAERYRVWAQDQLDVHLALSDSARGVAAAIDFSKTILNTVRAFVRGLIADTLAKLVSILYRYLPPAYPVAIAAEGLPLIIENTMAGTKMVRRLVEAFGRLGEHLGRLGELLARATKQLNRGVHATDIALRNQARTVQELYSANHLLARAGLEAVKEGTKYVGPRVANATAAGMSESTDPTSQPDTTETPAKRQRDYDRTRLPKPNTPTTNDH